jgi:DNA-binding response OmpR family regulator
MHVIVCSRRREVVEAISRALEQSGHRLTVCESGLEVLATVEIVEADLLILDMDTPGLNGLLLISAIKELAPRLKITAVSSRPSLDTRAVWLEGVTFATLSFGSDGGSDGGLGDLLAGLARIGGNETALRTKTR